MKLDIGIIEGKYRGIERGVFLEHLMDFSKKYTKKEVQEILDQLGAYEDYTGFQTANITTLNWIIEFANHLSNNGRQCEVIVFDDQPITEAFGYPLQLLGIDITSNLGESLLVTDGDRVPDHLLNENGLLNDEHDLEEAVSYCRGGDLNWEPCWVYRVCRDGTNEA